MTKPLECSWLNVLVTIKSHLGKICCEPFEQESIAQFEVRAVGTLAGQMVSVRSRAVHLRRTAFRSNG